MTFKTIFVENMIKLLILSRVNLQKHPGIELKIPKEVRTPLMLRESRSILIPLLEKKKQKQVQFEKVNHQSYLQGVTRCG